GTSLLQGLAQTRREAALWGASTTEFLRHTSEPTPRASGVEDGAALIGLLLAAVGLLLREFAGLPNADAIAALLHGLLRARSALDEPVVAGQVLSHRPDLHHLPVQEMEDLADPVFEGLAVVVATPADGRQRDHVVIGGDDVVHLELRQCELDGLGEVAQHVL